MPKAARVWRLLGDLLVIAGDVPAGETVGPREVWINRSPMPQPVVWATCPVASGETRIVIVGRLAPEAAAHGMCHLSARDENRATVLEAVWQANAALPGVDPAQLLADLDPAGRAKLVRQIIETCATWFKLADNAQFARLCRKLALAGATSSARLVRAVSLNDDLTFCHGSAAEATGDIVSVVQISDSAVRRNPYQPRVVTRGAQSTEFELLIDRAGAPATESRVLVFFTPKGMLTTLVEEGRLDGPESLLSWLESRGAEGSLPTQEYLLRCLKPYIASDERLQELVRELSLLLPVPARPMHTHGKLFGAAIDYLVATPDNGLFVKGWTFDPHQLIDHIVAISPFGKSQPLDPELFRQPRPDVAKHFELDAGAGEKLGFIAYLDGLHEPVPGVQYRFEVRLKSGSKVELIASAAAVGPVEARETVLGSVSPVHLNETMMADCIAPAAASLHKACLAGPRVDDSVWFGEAPRRVSRSVIVPLYRNLDFLRFQMVAFATDRDWAASELIYVLDSPEQRQELEHQLYGLRTLYDLPVNVVTMSRNFGYAAANNAGAAAARGRELILLNSDVVPAAPGWMSALSAFARSHRGAGAVGPKLLFEDDSLQHAGLYFGRDVRGQWLNRHFFKGYPRDYEPASVSREVPAVTGACALIDRSLYERVGGFSEDYIIGDYEDSDLCLKLLNQGRKNWYAASIELYHLERQSIAHSHAYSHTVASEYNRWLHIQRWQDAMADVMARNEGWGVQ
jgi:hypothetical protein